jgi:hypothetical protein
MALADDLLNQAHLLADRSPAFPIQADLRRAVSTAYYALFHLLIADSIELIAPAAPIKLPAKIGRAFAHAEMKQVCRAIANTRTTPAFSDLLPAGFSMDLQFIANTFVELQSNRHSADYDLAVVYNYADTLDLILLARRAFATWRSIRASDEANVFLSALLFGARWSK